MWSGLIMPAVESYAKAADVSDKLMHASIRVSIDGALLAAEQKEAKIASLLKEVSPSYQFTRIVIALPLLGDQAPPARPATDAEQIRFLVDVVSLDGVLLTSLECTLQQKHFERTLVQIVCAPALKQYFKLSPGAPKVAYDAIKIEVDGTATSGEGKSVTYARDALTPVKVKLTLPTTTSGASGSEEEAGSPSSSRAGKKKKGEKKEAKPGPSKKLGSPTFVVDLQMDNGETLTSLGTTLNSRFLAMSLTKALVAPALGEYAKQTGISIDPSKICVIVNGNQIESPQSTKCSSFLSADVELVSVVLLTPQGFRAPVAIIAPKTADFNVVVKPNLGDYDVRLNERWLAKPLLQSLIKPALKTVNRPGIDPKSVGVAVHGESISYEDASTKPSSSFVLQSGVPVPLELLLPEVDETEGAGAGANRRNSAVLQGVSTVVQGVKQGMNRLSSSMATLESARFQVNIQGGLKRWETDTELNSKWLNKALRDGLITPALKAYFKDDIGSVPVAAEDEGLRVEVNGSVVDEAGMKQKTVTFVDRETNGTTPTRVDIHLPTRQYALKRISKAS